MLTDCCSSTGFALIQSKSRLNVFVEVAAVKLCCRILLCCKDGCMYASSYAKTASARNCEVVEDSQYFKFLSANKTANWSNRQKDSLVIPHPAAALSKVVIRQRRKSETLHFPIQFIVLG